MIPAKEETYRDQTIDKSARSAGHTNELIETDDVLRLDVFSDTLKTVQVEYERKLSDLLTINSFYELCGEITVRLKRLLHTHKPPEGRPGTTEVAARMKLPDIPLPIFRVWAYFRKKFTALINDNESLSDY
jgi:hypothetical protein